ncbi:hypothetical protein FH966_08560 [Lentibacillus cibarius]|uniref:Ribosomal protein L7/L12 C-terminal domain-containing protein n=1 Tax=Lentibacillus cibarius TaxID=2583219 RepID=A0A549YIL1_9BACI|nr:hypothetical protein [Lentibacillus cibarius]TRM11727.1 hypothetical protein FH966_08560 [Lentibacillus cibarius]
MMIFFSFSEFWTNNIGAIFTVTALIVLVSDIYLKDKKIKTLREELKNSASQEYQDELAALAKEKLESEGDMKTIKYLREHKGMSMVDAKQLVDSLKKED